MATLSPPLLRTTFLFVFFLISGAMLKIAEGQASGQGAWCVAKPATSEGELQDNINYACNHVDCQLIFPGGPCYEHQNLLSRASVVMNLYYQAFGRNFFNCDFRGSAVITVTDPSNGGCKYKFTHY